LLFSVREGDKRSIFSWKGCFLKTFSAQNVSDARAKVMVLEPKLLQCVELTALTILEMNLNIDIATELIAL